MRKPPFLHTISSLLILNKKFDFSYKEYVVIFIFFLKNNPQVEFENCILKKILRYWCIYCTSLKCLLFRDIFNNINFKAIIISLTKQNV